MESDPRVLLDDVVCQLATSLRTLRDFGVHQVARSDWRPASAPCPAAGDPIPTQPPAPAAAGRAQAHLFAPPVSARPEAQRPGPAVWQANPLSPGQAQAELDALCQHIGDCTRCPLSRTRSKVVFGDGNPVARLALVGEGPGGEEDRTGRPFVGPAGQLLERILQAMGLARQQVYICNVVKCRPPQNRTPAPEEMRTCGQFLARQLAIVRPQFILALGGTAAAYLLNTQQPMGKLRGRFFDHSESGARIMPTYHPAYLLRNEAAKKPVWMDVQQVMAAMNAGQEG